MPTGREGNPGNMSDLFDVYPELSAAIGELCGGASWCVTGVSALPSDGEGRLCLEIAKPKHWLQGPAGVTTIGLGAIGGSLEPGEMLLDCLQREAREEIGAPLQVHSAGAGEAHGDTYLVYEQRQIVPVRLPQRDYPRPAFFTVSANLHRRDTLDTEVLTIATFCAHLLAPPVIGDLFGLLRAPRDTLSRLLGAKTISLEELRGLEGLRLDTREPLPANALLQPVWTVRSLQLLQQAGHLGPLAP